MMPSVFHISLSKTLYYSVRFRGQILVMRGTRILLERGARISLAPGARLYLGRNQAGTSPLALRINRGGRLSIRGAVQISRGCRIVVAENAHLEMDDQVYLNYDASVTCWDHISFGPESGMSWNTNVIDGNGHIVHINGKTLPRTTPISFGVKAMIGTGAVVVGASIGDFGIVAAGAVVTRDVPAKTLVGGNPARVISDDVYVEP